jgi:hypothetical protein
VSTRWRTTSRHSPSPRYLNSFSTRLVGRLADLASYTYLGLRADDVPQFEPGRFVNLSDGVLVQFRRQQAIVAPKVEPGDPTCIKVNVLNGFVERAQLSMPKQHENADRVWHLPIGWNEYCDTVGLDLAPGIHAVIGGGPQSGKSTMLRALATTAAGLGLSVATINFAVAGCSLLTLSDEVTELANVLTPTLLLVDDAEMVDALLTPRLIELLQRKDIALRIVAAGRTETLRSPTSWVTGMRAGRTGVLLAPNGLDGDLLKMALSPRLPSTWPKGRGLLVNLGASELIQIAR